MKTVFAIVVLFGLAAFAAAACVPQCGCCQPIELQGPACLKDAGDPCSLQLLRLELELELRPAAPVTAALSAPSLAAALAAPAPPSPPPPPRCAHHHHHHHHCLHCHHQHRHHGAGDLRHENSVLQECTSCGNVPMIDQLLISSNDSNSKQQKCSAAHHSSMWSNNFTLFNKLCSDGCEITRAFNSYQLPFQFLFTGQIQGNWESVLEAVKFLANLRKEQRTLSGTCQGRHVLLSVTDKDGNTPLLIVGRQLLKDGAFDQAAQLSKMLLEAGSDPNAVNTEGRSLLSYSINYMDQSVELTRVLLNGGASVWPLGPSENGHADTVENFGASNFILEQCSAFTWFLRGVIRRRKLDDHCCRTLNLISEAMGEHPTRMHSHVMRTMFRHAKCYKVLGPVFYQLKIAMMRYWTQPLDLRFMCRRSIRSAVGSERMLAGATSCLGLPKPLERYICLE